MTRALAHKRNVKQKMNKTTRPAAKAKPKAASKLSHGNSSSKAKVSLNKAKHKKAEEKKKALPAARGHSKKDLSHMEVEARKAAAKTEVAPSLEAPARLLRQTKTTAAALAHLEKGIEHIYQKDFKKARTELTTLLQSYPGEMDILARARSYMQICDREEAGQKKATLTADQLYAMGILEHNKANYDKAIVYFQQSLEKHPNADYVYYSIAASLALKGELAESVKKLRKAVELNAASRIHAKNDSDFAALENHKEFMELVGLNAPPANGSEQ